MTLHLTSILEISISADPQNLIAMNTLAGMGILTDDDHLVEAALSEIVVLPIDERRTLDPQQDVGYLMTQHYLRQVIISYRL